MPDSVEGRLEMVALHLVATLVDIGRDEAGEPLARALTEAFVTDMDDCMREIGVGDLSIPRKVKKAAAALGERHRDYGEVIARGDADALAAAIARHIGAVHGARVDAVALARHVLVLARVPASEAPRDGSLSRAVHDG